MAENEEQENKQKTQKTKIKKVPRSFKEWNSKKQYQFRIQWWIGMAKNEAVKLQAIPNLILGEFYHTHNNTLGCK